MPLEPGLVSGGVIVNEGQVAKKIRELLTVVQHVKPETSGIKKLTESLTETFAGKGKIVVGLSGRDSLYRVLSLPPLPDSLLAGSSSTRSWQSFASFHKRTLPCISTHS